MSARPLPELIAHRGLPRRHRENTLAGFVDATAAGAQGWELDVHATRDGVVVVHHDPVLPAAAGDSAGLAIAALDWATIGQATVGAAGARVPTLDTVLGAAGVLTTVYVEVKARGIEQAVVDCLRRHTTVHTAVHSFDHRIAQRIGAMQPSIPAGILLDSYLVDPVHALRAAGARDLWAHRDMVDAALVDTVQAAGGRVIVWTVNDPAMAQVFAAMGVDGLCTDVVDELRTVLRN